MRICRVRARPAKMTEEKAVELMKSIADWQDEVKDLTAKISAASKELLEGMQAMKTINVSADDLEADIITPAGRSSTEIDIVKLRGLLNDKDFLLCVTPSVTKTKEILSGRQFNSVSKTIPGTPGEKKVVVWRKNGPGGDKGTSKRGSRA